MPRETRKESKGDRMPPAAFCVKPIFSPSAASAQMTAPPTESEWPFRYFVVEWTTASQPSASGFWKNGVANVLSTTTRIFAPIRRALVLRDGREGGEVGDLHRRVRGRLDEEHARRRRDGLAHRLGVRRVDVGERDAEVREDLREEAVRAAVRVPADEDVVPRLDEREHERRLGCHPRGERVGDGAALERGELLFEREARRVLRARVLVALARLAERFLDVRGGLEDRDGHGARDGLGLLPRMDAGRRETGGLLRGVAHGRDDSNSESPARTDWIIGWGERVQPFPPRPPYRAGLRSR